MSAAIALLSGAAGVAGTLPAPEGPVILAVSGSIAADNGPADGVVEFDLAGLEALGLTRVVTRTSWTEGPQDFEGVLLRDLLTAVGAAGQTLHMTALNDYSVEIPVSDAERYEVLVALRQNGALMPVRNMGQLWIIYPTDQHEDLQVRGTDDKMIWQLRAIDVR